MPQRQLGELMTELGLISEEQLATVLEVQQRSKRPLGQIIVELGFASGAAVAHALAMQKGGALKTEYGFALGVHPEQGDPDSDETRSGLPKLRLAPTAVVPPVRANIEPVEEPEAVEAANVEGVEERAPLAAPPPATSEAEPVESEPTEEVEDAAPAEPLEVAPEAVVELLRAGYDLARRALIMTDLVRGVLSVEGAVVLVHDHVPGVALDRVLAERGALEEAEVVTLIVPLAQALAAVHAAGLVHGRVSPSSILSVTTVVPCSPTLAWPL